MRYGLSARLVFNLIYAALQAFMSAMAAWATAKLLGSVVWKKVRRMALRVIRACRAALYAAFQFVMDITVRPIVRTWCNIREIAREAATQAVYDRLTVIEGGLQG